MAKCHKVNDLRCGMAAVYRVVRQLWAPAAAAAAAAAAGGGRRS